MNKYHQRNYLRVRLLPAAYFFNIMKGVVNVVLALAVTTAEFILIHRLISREPRLSHAADSVNLIDFIRIDRQAKPAEKKNLVDDIELLQPEQEPPPPEVLKPQVKKQTSTQLAMPMLSLNIPLSLSGTPYMGDFAKNTSSLIRPAKPASPQFDANIKPTVRVDPVYPRRALHSGIEGIVTVEFTIATDGSVKDAAIVKAEPKEIFDQAVLEAIYKWRFSSYVVDGSPVERRARQDIKFTLQR